MRIQANYYQQFDADPGREVPAEGYGGWKKGEIELNAAKTALVVMHAWDNGTREAYPGWWRAVEYIPRAAAIGRTVFPPLLASARGAGFKVFHVVGGGDYYKQLSGYRRTVELAGPPPPAPEWIEGDESLAALKEFRRQHVFVGPGNEADVKAGFAKLDFQREAKPVEDEPVAEDAHQLAALCRVHGVNHLIYTGYAINWCLLMSPGGMLDMSRRGVMCSAVRQATTAVENRESAREEWGKELGLWRVALAFGFVFDSDVLIRAWRGM
jgi:nicotinamidase-related amidase